MGLNAAANRLHAQVLAVDLVHLRHYHGELPLVATGTSTSLTARVQARLTDGTLVGLDDIPVSIAGCMGHYEFPLPQRSNAHD